jgi:hypothetical protein
MIFQNQNIDQLAIIADSTYIFIDKSSDNELQRLTYSDQKKRHFVRPMTLCSSDGRIIDLYSPYFAVNNDAQIILDVLKNNKNITELIKPGDVMIFDRGFKDCLKELTVKYELNVHLPACKS